ncbi:MAG: fused MFS/spermidine synthase [bacterium]|nr:fused MFS/spermidine synthase [bacterium]
MNFWAKILFEGESPFNGEIKVFEILGVRKLSASGFVQSRSVKDNGESEFYWNALAHSVPLKTGNRVLLLGMSAGTVALSLRKKYPETIIDGVEIDPLMIDLGKRFFYLEKAKVNVFVGDARSFVKTAKNSYDLIILDLFVGDKVPSFVFDKDFMEKLGKLLKSGGRLVMNRIYDSKKEIKSFEQAFARYFRVVNKKSGPAFAETGNLILVGENYG